jgi:CheY-like chemotaxis protein
MEKKAAPEPSKIELAGRRVLIAEDIMENAEIVMDLLELEGVESEHAENGKIALDMFTRSPEGYYDAILMDLRMPVMDGLEASRQIRASSHPDAKKIPIIAVTANAFESDVKATMEAGMNAHLAKPADSDLLYETMRQQIARRMAE